MNDTPGRHIAESDKRDSHELPELRPGERKLIKEIDYFERLAKHHEPDHSGKNAADSPRTVDGSGYAPRLYRDFAQRRRQLLQALRDGRPEAWREYSGQ